MQTTETNEINVTVVRMGRDTIHVSLEEGATVADAINAAGMDFNTLERDVFCDGVKAEGAFVVDNGDVLSIVASKVDAGM